LYVYYQVVEVFEVAACDWVAGAVGVGEGVEESLQAALQKLHERFLRGELATAAQHLAIVDGAGGVGVRSIGW
jgi:hypothetical protein